MLVPKCIYPKCIFAKCTQLACLLSFASLLCNYLVNTRNNYHMTEGIHVLVDNDPNESKDCLRYNPTPPPAK